MTTDKSNTINFYERARDYSNKRIKTAIYTDRYKKNEERPRTSINDINRISLYQNEKGKIYINFIKLNLN